MIENYPQVAATALSVLLDRIPPVSRMPAAAVAPPIPVPSMNRTRQAPRGKAPSPDRQQDIATAIRLAGT